MKSSALAESIAKKVLSSFQKIIKARPAPDPDICNMQDARIADIYAGEPPTITEFVKILYALGIATVINFHKESDLNSNTKVKFTKFDESAIPPTRSRQGDAGYDLYALHDCLLGPGQSDTIKTGIGIALPSYSVGLIWPRSGLSVKHDIETGAGVIDSNYRGDITVKLYNHGKETYQFHKGDRIAQLIISAKFDADFIECDNLPDSDRNDAGFGSSGK